MHTLADVRLRKRGLSVCLPRSGNLDGGKGVKGVRKQKRLLPEIGMSDGH